MHPLPKQTVERINQEFAYKDKGFTLKQINPYFENYQTGLSAPGFDGVVPKKGDHFVEVVLSMHPRNQRLALIDLCSNPPNIKNCHPYRHEKVFLSAFYSLMAQHLFPMKYRVYQFPVFGNNGGWHPQGYLNLLRLQLQLLVLWLNQHAKRF